jgi:hypothetical protein
MSYQIAKQIQESLDEMIYDAATKCGFWTDGENYSLEEHQKIDLTHKLYEFSDELLSSFMMMVAINHFDKNNPQ